MLLNLIDAFISNANPRHVSRMLKSTPRAFFDGKKRLAFRHIIRYAYKNSPFYRKKFDECGIDPERIKEPSDLGDFYTTSEDIVNNAEEFLTRRPHIVFESSGTTGRNKRLYFTQDELDEIGRMSAAGLFLSGVAENDRLVNCFDFSFWIPGMITQKAIEKAGIFGMAAGKIDPIEVYRRIPQYKFNVVLGEPTWLIKLTEIAEKNGSYPLKFIIGGAEEMPDAARPWMESVWQGAQVRMVYASVESGGIIGFEPFAACKNYHINENNFWVEIVNPDKEGYGEVVFTTLTRKTMPLIRYKNRDVSRILDQPCPCGLPYRKLARIRGRTDEMVIASGGNLYPLMFEQILKSVEGITTDWQIVFKLRGIKEVMEFNLEPKDARDRDVIKEMVFSGMRLLYPDLWKNLLLGIFDTEFIYHTPGELRTKRKLMRLLDQRYGR